MKRDYDINRTVQPIRTEKDRKAISRYLRSKSLRDYALFEFGLRVGRRVSDLVNLNVGDVARLDRRGRLVIRNRLMCQEKKTNKFSDILINQFARRVLSRYLTERKAQSENLTALLDEPLFYSRTSGSNGEHRLSRKRVWEILKEAGDACELDYKIGTHSLRKTFGYDLHRRGVDITLIQKALNHSSPEITLAYIGITQNDIDAAMKRL